MAKLIGFLLILVALPLGIVALVLLAVMIRPHKPLSPCIVHQTQPVTLYEGTVIDVVWPWQYDCDVRYDDN